MTINLDQYKKFVDNFELYQKASSNNETLMSDEIGQALDSEEIKNPDGIDLLPNNFFTNGGGKETDIRKAAVADAIPKKLENIVNLTNDELIGEVAGRAVSSYNINEKLKEIEYMSPYKDFEDKKVVQSHIELSKYAILLASQDPNKYQNMAQIIMGGHVPKGWQGTIERVISNPMTGQDTLNYMFTVLKQAKQEEFKAVVNKGEDNKLNSYASKALAETIKTRIPKQDERGSPFQALFTSQLYKGSAKLSDLYEKRDQAQQ